jgi:hypothetical protein
MASSLTRRPWQALRPRQESRARRAPPTRPETPLLLNLAPAGQRAFDTATPSRRERSTRATEATRKRASSRPRSRPLVPCSLTGRVGQYESDSGHNPNIGRWAPNLLLMHGPGCGGTCEPGCSVPMLDGQSGELRTNPGIVTTAMASMGYRGGASNTSHRHITKRSQPADSSPAPENRIPHRYARASCTATCRICSCAVRVRGTRDADRNASPIANTHHAARPTGTSATRHVQKGAGVRLQSQPVQVKSPPRAAVRMTTIMEDGRG